MQCSLLAYISYPVGTNLKIGTLNVTLKKRPLSLRLTASPTSTDINTVLQPAPEFTIWDDAQNKPAQTDALKVSDLITHYIG